MPPRKRAAATVAAEPSSDEDSGAPTAAEAAAAEVADDDIKLTFRGFDYVIPRTRAGSLHYEMARRAMDLVSMVYELLGEMDARRLLMTVNRDEEPYRVCSEFLQAFGEAVGVGNSSASG